MIFGTRPLDEYRIFKKWYSEMLVLAQKIPEESDIRLFGSMPTFYTLFWVFFFKSSIRNAKFSLWFFSFVWVWLNRTYFNKLNRRSENAQIGVVSCLSHVRPWYLITYPRHWFGENVFWPASPGISCSVEYEG